MNPKTIITPLQMWLLSQGRCVGCGRVLNGENKKSKNGTILVTCRCRRIFVYQSEDDSYRRALFEEIVQ